MPDGGDLTEWDLLTLIARWNLYGLPVLLLVIIGTALVRHRFRPAAAVWLNGIAAVRRIGLIHYGLALRYLIQLVQELLTWRTMGILQSNETFNVRAPALAVLVSALLGFGLRRLSPLARRLAIGWYVLWSLVAIGITAWMWHYRAAVDLADWPDYLVGKAMPLVLVAVMFSPQIKRVFAAPGGQPSARAQEPESAPAPSGWPVVSLLTLLLLVVVGSTLLVDAADWLSRLVSAPDLGESP
jgi:hypothetical protein